MRANGTAFVPRPPADVFAVLADPRHPAGRSPRIVAAEAAEPIAAGSSFRLQFVMEDGASGWLDGRVVTYQPPHLVAYLVWGRRRGLLRTLTTYRVRPEAGGSRVEGRTEVSVLFLLRWSVRRALQEQLDAILLRLPADAG